MRFSRTRVVYFQFVCVNLTQFSLPYHPSLTYVHVTIHTLFAIYVYPLLHILNTIHVNYRLTLPYMQYSDNTIRYYIIYRPYVHDPYHTVVLHISIRFSMDPTIIRDFRDVVVERVVKCAWPCCVTYRRIGLRPICRTYSHMTQFDVLYLCLCVCQFLYIVCILLSSSPLHSDRILRPSLYLWTTASSTDVQASISRTPREKRWCWCPVCKVHCQRQATGRTHPASHCNPTNIWRGRLWHVYRHHERQGSYMM